jgi:hypothetical protein
MGRREPGVYDPPGRVGYLRADAPLGASLVTDEPGGADDSIALGEGDVLVELGAGWTAIHEVISAHMADGSRVLALRRLRLLTDEERARVSARAGDLSPASSLKRAPTWLVLIVLELVT